ncbi:sodium/potassium/calcium exchanger 1 [Ipomoea triloba]|uniref:sodium/potassium/calcium exchanger 1 n=1 Tax=Ipomoea triloba TaxID=35885 RepID=UPI00125E55A6|nr:sodium/potassium/calcium exchanger 1 [Ipomoea triloba]
MEIESCGGSITRLIPGSITVFGRGAGVKDNDRAVSRRQLLFQLNHEGKDPRVRFEVAGKNPVWVHGSTSGGVKAYRSSERGEMESGDMFCVSAKNPVWFTLKRIDFDAEGETDMVRDSLIGSELAGSPGSGHGQRGIDELELDSINLSDIDPVKEFGLVVMGREFDGYPKKMIRDIKNWDWFIEEFRDESDCDEGRGRKRKKVGKNDDEEWTGESEEEKETITKSRKSQRPKYMTRSNDCGKPSKGVGKHKLSAQRKNTSNEDSEDDETLGGFIVEDDEMEEDKDVGDEEEEEEEEEEEFDEVEDEDDLED